MLVQPTQWPQRPKPGRPPHVVIIIIGATIAETLTGCTPVGDVVKSLGNVALYVLLLYVLVCAVRLIAGIAAFNRDRCCANCKECKSLPKLGEDGKYTAGNWCEKHHSETESDGICSFHHYEDE